MQVQLQVQVHVQVWLQAQVQVQVQVQMQMQAQVRVQVQLASAGAGAGAGTGVGAGAMAGANSLDAFCLEPSPTRISILSNLSGASFFLLYDSSNRSISRKHANPLWSLQSSSSSSCIEFYFKAYENIIKILRAPSLELPFSLLIISQIDLYCKTMRILSETPSRLL